MKLGDRLAIIRWWIPGFSLGNQRMSTDTRYHRKVNIAALWRHTQRET